MEMIPCKNLDYDSHYSDCEIKTCAPMFPDVKYWQRNKVPYQGAAIKVQFCKSRGRINDIFSCYGESSCHEPLPELIEGTKEALDSLSIRSE